MVSEKERATVAGIFDSGSKFGGAVAMPLIAWMIAVFDWKLTFLLIGLVGVAWGIVWMIFFKENPADHKRVNEAELAHIREGQAHMEETGGLPAAEVVSAIQISQHMGDVHWIFHDQL